MTAKASIQSDRLTELTAVAVEEDAIRTTLASHPNEIMSQVPGVWISRGSGQEHLTAIRSGVLTGAGACGAYLLLENGIPIRPSAFCNVNGLFELNTEQATSIEVVRGPASSRFGGNALHGAINAVTLSEAKPGELAAQAGSDSYRRLQLHFPGNHSSLKVLAAHSGGWRDATGYTNFKANAQHVQERNEWNMVHTFAVTSLDQETGGYVTGQDAYLDPVLRVSNPNPEAYRRASSFRMASHWRHREVALVPYVRHSRMDFLMHFLPGQPTEKNEQTSGGVLLTIEKNFPTRSFAYGLNAELLGVGLSEVQTNPTLGSAFLVETRPAGTHYDFSVAGKQLAAFHDGRLQLRDRLTLSYRLRGEWNSYSYTNHHTVGNLRDDGTACGFGGCLYTRPADRTDRFFDLAANFALEQHLNGNFVAYLAGGSGFRPPQVAELYRLQSGQEFADIDSEALNSIEVGLNWRDTNTELQLSLYSSQSRDSIVRDAEGFNQSGGKTNSTGFEWVLKRQINAKNAIRLTGTFARHRYDFTQNLARREVITAGNDVDTAPRRLVSAIWDQRLTERLDHSLEYVHIGEYFMDAANTATYPGHTVLNWRLALALTPRAKVDVHVRNLTDEKYADRADLSFGNVRYFPARSRNMQVGITYEL